MTLINIYHIENRIIVLEAKHSTSHVHRTHAFIHRREIHQASVKNKFSVPSVCSEHRTRAKLQIIKLREKRKRKIINMELRTRCCLHNALNSTNVIWFRVTATTTQQRHRFQVPTSCSAVVHRLMWWRNASYSKPFYILINCHLSLPSTKWYTFAPAKHQLIRTETSVRVFMRVAEHLLLHWFLYVRRPKRKLLLFWRRSDSFCRSIVETRVYSS